MRLLPLAVLAPLLFAALPARAQGTPPDIVRRKDGGIVRGTIEEMNPKGDVKITLPSGEKRSIPMADVTCAGPLAECTSAAAPPPASEPAPVAPVAPKVVRPFPAGADLVHVELSASVEPVAVFITPWRSPQAGQVPKNDDPLTSVCTTPCAAEIPKGAYRLWMSTDDASPAVEKPRDFQRDIKLEVGVDRHQGMHVAGWIIAGVATTVGASLIAYGLTQDQVCDASGSCSKDSTPILVGVAVTLVGGGLGLVMALKGRDGTVRVLPGVSARTTTRGGTEAGTYSPEGATLSVRF